ncbi:MAG: hypothetical protein NZ992_06420 [Candidatus Korarchaeum sp.]|nr:hypothetical protein [Candidatus Korarchaeum sp.]
MIYYLLADSLLERVSTLYPLFKVIPIAFAVVLVLLRDRVSRILSLYAAVNTYYPPSLRGSR